MKQQQRQLQHKRPLGGALPSHTTATKTTGDSKRQTSLLAHKLQCFSVACNGVCVCVCVLVCLCLFACCEWRMPVRVLMVSLSCYCTQPDMPHLEFGDKVVLPPVRVESSAS